MALVTGFINKGNLKEFLETGVFIINNNDLHSILIDQSDNSWVDNLSKPIPITGRFIRCREKLFICEIHLKTEIPSTSKLVEAKKCELSINRIATLEIPNIQYNGSGYYATSVLLLLKVAPELRDQVAAIHFGRRGEYQEGSNATPLGKGFYQIELPTTGVQNGSGSISNYGYFRLELKDGRVFAIRSKNGGDFDIDQNFASNNTTKIATKFSPTSAKDLKLLKSTAELYDKDGSARYINPYRCL